MSNYQNVKKFRKMRKIAMVESMGGCCQVCGYSNCNRALVFHHIDSGEKEFNFNELSHKPWVLLPGN